MLQPMAHQQQGGILDLNLALYQKNYQKLQELEHNTVGCTI